MYHIKDDQRAIRSAAMLYEGLGRLMREMPFSAIKVKDLVDAANVGRTTFYRNFDDIEDILRWRCDRVFDGLIVYLIEYTQKYGNDSPTALLKPLLRYFYLHSDIIELLITAKRLDIAQASFQRVAQPFKIQARTLLHVEDEYIDYGLTIRIGIAISILVHWIETDKKQAPDELADKLKRMIENMVTFNQLL